MASQTLKQYFLVSVKIWLVSSILGFIFLLIMNVEIFSIPLSALFYLIAAIELYSASSIPFLILSLHMVSLQNLPKRINIILLVIISMVICTILFEIPFSIISGGMKGVDKIRAIYLLYMLSVIMSTVYWANKFYPEE